MIEKAVRNQNRYFEIFQFDILKHFTSASLPMKNRDAQTVTSAESAIMIN